MKAAYRKGFTLIEILIVVIILGILAAIIIPQFTNASQDAKQSAVASTVQSVRGQIELYKLQHGDSYPTQWSDLIGTSVVNGQTFGPYLQAVPNNPFANSGNGTTCNFSATTITAAQPWGLITSGGATKFYGFGKGSSVIGD